MTHKEGWDEDSFEGSSDVKKNIDKVMNFVESVEGQLSYFKGIMSANEYKKIERDYRKMIDYSMRILLTRSCE